MIEYNIPFQLSQAAESLFTFLLYKCSSSILDRLQRIRYTPNSKMKFIFIFIERTCPMSQRGTYQTRQQEAIESLFASRAEECLTAETVYNALQLQGMDVGKTTVYRAITRLCQAGRLRKYVSHDSGGAALFQYNPCQESHLHIRCVHCGALAHLHCDEVLAFSNHLSHHHGFTLDEGQTILYGCCEDCQHTHCETK